MTKNEIATLKESTFSYDFKPAVIELKNYETLVETAEMIAKHYDSLVLTNADLSEINETHKELNSFIKGLEEGRKNVKREYNEPLNEFENKIKAVVERLNQPLQAIKVARDEILTKQEEARSEALNDYLERQLKDSIVRLEDLEMSSSWLNKGNWTDKLNPRKPLVDEIKREISRVEEVEKNRLAQREILEQFLKSKDLEVDGWLEQLEYRSATEIMDSILKAEERKKQAEEERKRIEEAEQKKFQEMTQRQHEEAHNVEHPFEPGNLEPWEQIANDVVRDFEEVEPKKITNIIEVTATIEQLKALNEFMVTNGIEVREYDPEFKIDNTLGEMPF